MKLSAIASTFSLELLKTSGASGVDAFLGQCADIGVKAAVAGLFATGGGAALGILGSAVLLVGPILWEQHKDKKRQQEFKAILNEILGVLDLVASDASEANRQIAEFAERRQPVWARISGADQADFARRVTDSMQGMIREMLTELGKDNKALLDHLTVLKDIAYDSNFRLVRIETALDQIQTHQREQATKADIDELKKLILARSPGSTEAQSDPSTDRYLTNALNRAAKDADRGEVIAKRVLLSQNPDALVDYLKDKRTHIDEVEFLVAERIQQEKIELDRELAVTCYLIGRIEDTESALRRILDLLPNDSDALNRLGHVHRLRGDLSEAQSLYQRVLDEGPGESWQAAALGNLGVIEQTRGNLDPAEDYLKRSLAIDTELGLKEGMAASLGNLGLIERTRGNLDAAEGYHTRSLAIDTELGRKEGMAAALGNLGLIEQTRGNLDAARDYHTRSLAIETEIGRKEGMAADLGNLGLIEQTRGNLDAAEDYLKQSLAIDTEIGRKEGMAASLGNLGLIEKDHGNMPEACKLWRRSLDLYEQIGVRPMVERIQSWIQSNCPDQPGG